MNDQDQINEDERQEAATETPAFLGCPVHMPKQLPGGFDGTERGEAVSRPLQKENKFGLLANGVQMIRFASGKMVTLIGKRDRGQCERHGGRTDKVIYKVTISRESKTASVDIDGVCKMSLVGGRNGLLENGALAMLNCIIRFNAMSNRHKRANYKRRKAAAAEAAKQEGK